MQLRLQWGELCNQEAPFEKEDGSPYLEVHHLLRLKNCGPDTVENYAALCPNCHRKFDFKTSSINKTKRKRFNK